MQNDIRKSKKKAPVLCAVGMILLLSVFLVTIMAPLIGEAAGKTMAVGFLLIYGSVILAVIVGIVAALRQRLREIEGGEEEDAKKY